MSQKILVSQDLEDLRIDKFLFKAFEINFSLAQKLIREKDVKVNGSRVDKSYKTQIEDEIEIFADLKRRDSNEKYKPSISKEQIAKFLSYIIFEDENLVVIDKPSGLAVQGRSISRASIDDMLPALKKEGRDFLLVHRLDRDTSGILILAKNKKAAVFLSECFKKKTIRKTYQALVLGVVKKEKGEINIPLLKKKVGDNEKVYPDFQNGKEAISKYKLLKNFGDFSLLEFQPITGRTHQLRVHAKEIGHAIIGDVKYGGKKAIVRNVANRLCLHACKIEIDDYFGDKLVVSTVKPDFLKKR